MKCTIECNGCDWSKWLSCLSCCNLCTGSFLNQWPQTWIFKHLSHLTCKSQPWHVQWLLLNHWCSRQPPHGNVVSMTCLFLSLSLSLSLSVCVCVCLQFYFHLDCCLFVTHKKKIKRVLIQETLKSFDTVSVWKFTFEFQSKQIFYFEVFLPSLILSILLPHTFNHWMGVILTFFNWIRWLNMVLSSNWMKDGEMKRVTGSEDH